MPSSARRMLIAGNWKMNGLSGDLAMAAEIRDGAADAPAGVDVLVCPPATLLMAVGDAMKGSPVAVGGQDCHVEQSGAHTGDISAEMLADAAARYVIVGHSERRQHHRESDALVKAKSHAAHRAGLIAIVCLGETQEQREAGRAIQIVRDQVRAIISETANAENTVIAYEPVWAIGTGETATPDDVAQVHREIRQVLSTLLGTEDAARMQILYGGSVKPSNAKQLMALDDVDGALVGGASLRSDDFLAIARAC